MFKELEIEIKLFVYGIVFEKYYVFEVKVVNKEDYLNVVVEVWVDLFL